MILVLILICGVSVYSLRFVHNDFPIHISSTISSLNNGISCPPRVVLWDHECIKKDIPEIAKGIIIILFLVLLHPSLIIAILLGYLVIPTDLKMLSH